MSDFNDSNRGVMPPTAGTIYAPKGYSGTDPATLGPFAKNKIHMVTVGTDAVIMVFASEPGLSGLLSGANVAYLNAGDSFTFRASVKALYLYVDALDGGTYQVSVFQRES